MGVTANIHRIWRSLSYFGFDCQTICVSCRENGSIGTDLYPYPGNTTTTITWYCTDAASGTKTELGILPMAFYAGLIYGLLLFVVIVGFMFIHSKRTSPPVLPARDGAGQTSWDNTFFDQAQQSQRLLHFNVQAKHFIQLLSFILTRMPLPG